MPLRVVSRHRTKEEANHSLINFQNSMDMFILHNINSQEFPYEIVTEKDEV